MARSFFCKLFKKSDSSPQEPTWTALSPGLDFDLDSCRFLLIRESHHGHKTLLFDSKATQKLHSPFPPEVQVIGSHGYKVTKSGPDVKFFAEMMMGTISLSKQNNAFKIHKLDNSGTLWSCSYMMNSHSRKKGNSTDSFASSSFGSQISKIEDERDSGFFSCSHLADQHWKRGSSPLSSNVSPMNSSELLLPAPLQQQPKRSKIALGLVMTVPDMQTLFLPPAYIFMEELMEVAKIRVDEAIRTRRKVAFVHEVYGIHIDLINTMTAFVASQRLQMTAWHLTQFKDYLGLQFVSLRSLLDTKEKRFFLCSWLTAILTHCPDWVSSFAQDDLSDTFFDEHHNSRFVLSCKGENVAQLKGLIFASSYFFRAAIVKRQKVACQQQLEEKHFKAFRELVEMKKEEELEESSRGVLFVLGENEKLVCQPPPSLEVNDEPAFLPNEAIKESLSYMKVLLPGHALFEENSFQLCDMPYGICITDHILPSEMLQGTITTDCRDVCNGINACMQSKAKVLWLHGNMETGLVEMHRDNCEGQSLIFAPLVANIVDVMDSAAMQPSSDNLFSQIEDGLYRIVLLSKLLTSLIKSPASMLNLSQLIKILGVDSNDIPLLMSVAAFQCPELRSSYGLSSE